MRYDAVNAMLLNEFIKGHRKVVALESGVAHLAASLKEQDSKIQTLSAQLELSKFATERTRGGGPAPQTVLNNNQ